MRKTLSPSLSLSTMWMQHRSATVVDWWEQVQRLGFQHIELSHIVTPAMLGGFTPSDIPVSSVHFPAPTLPHPTDSRPADVLLSSPEPELRRWAVEQGRRSIDLAASCGASSLCLHAGQVDMPQTREWILRQRYLGGYYGSPVYDDALAALLQERTAAVAPNLTAVRKSLDELARYAEAFGIRLGIETRLFITEIPSLDEAKTILANHDPAVLGLWLDTGHAQMQAHLGMSTLQDWLTDLGERIVGVHFHDTIGLRDHLLPSTGAIDFPALAHYLPAKAVRVCEFDWYFSPEEIQAAASYLTERGCGSLSHSH